MSGIHTLPLWLGLLASGLSPSLHAGGYDRWPLQPRLDVRYVAAGRVPYLADSAGLRPALAASGGDHEAGVVTLHVSHREEQFENHYKGVGISLKSSFHWNLRTGEISYFSTTSTTYPDGKVEVKTSRAPFPPAPGSANAECARVPGQVEEKHTLRTTCTVLHDVLRPAAAPDRNAWRPVAVAAVMRAEPLPTGCNPVDRGPRVVTRSFVIPPNGSVDFDLGNFGLRNEQVYPDGGWTLAFNVSTHDR